MTVRDISASSQLIAVESSGSRCTAYFYEKTDGSWQQVRSASGYVGKNGVSDKSREGDCCTPKGLFGLGFAFGTQYVDTLIEYRLINDNCYWVDDPNSPLYNQWVESDNITWNSAEHLADYPVSYKYSLVINYNTDPVISGKGSAIFLHCSNGSPTAGCVSIPEQYMLYALKWLRPENTPIILIS